VDNTYPVTVSNTLSIPDNGMRSNNPWEPSGLNTILVAAIVGGSFGLFALLTLGMWCRNRMTTKTKTAATFIEMNPANHSTTPDASVAAAAV